MAAQGNPNGQFLLGLSYLNGDGVPKDEAEGIKWFRKAATKNQVGAQSMLGTCYLLGQCGLEKNLEEGVKWTRKAADQNDADAQVTMGHLYVKQEPVDWNSPDFKDLSPKQIESIKTVNYSGVEEVIEQDDSVAVDWYRKAIRNGHVNARMHLGSAYEYGGGVPEDYIEAYKWYILAAAQGDVGGRLNRDRFKRNLTRTQIAEAQRRASKWMKDNPDIWRKGQANAQNTTKVLREIQKQQARNNAAPNQ